MKAVSFLFLPLLIAGGNASAQDHSEHSGHAMPSPPVAAVSAVPPPPGDHAADTYYDPAEMARARAMLRHEAGGMGASMLLIDRMEARPGSGADGYAWEAEGWSGGDINRIAFSTEGEGVSGGVLDHAEVQIGWSHALDPWFTLRAGVRQDFGPGPQRTHGVVAVEGLAPYLFHVGGQLFLSHKGEVSARAEVSYDQRITQRLIAQPAAELNIAAQDVPETRMGSGLASVEMGLRLRYEIIREFAPYMGVHWERRLGETARLARADGESASSLRFVTGIRVWF